MEFGQLYQAFFETLTAYALRFTRSRAAAEDIAQEAFARAWSRWHELHGLSPAQQQAWLYRTARNCFYDAMRRRAKEEQAPETLPEPPAEDDLTAAEVAQCLAVLDGDARQLVVLRYFCGWNSSQLAERFDIPAATVRTRLRAAAKKLRQEYTGTADKNERNR